MTEAFDDWYVDLDDRAAFERRDLAGAFDFLAAVIEARFVTIRAGLDMTRKEIA